MDESIFNRRLEDQLCFQLYRASNGLGRIYTRALKPFGLTFSQYLVLLALCEEEDITVTNIGLLTGMVIGTLNPILNRMEEHGWIIKTPYIEDKRMTLISMTNQAHETKPRINNSILREMKECHLEELDILTLMQQLKLLQKQLDKVNDEA